MFFSIFISIDLLTKYPLQMCQWINCTNTRFSHILSCKYQHTFQVRRTPHPVIVIIRDNSDYTRVLVYSCYYRVGGPPKFQT